MVVTNRLRGIPLAALFFVYKTLNPWPKINCNKADSFRFADFCTKCKII